MVVSCLAFRMVSYKYKKNNLDSLYQFNYALGSQAIRRRTRQAIRRSLSARQRRRIMGICRHSCPIITTTEAIMVNITVGRISSRPLCRRQRVSIRAFRRIRQLLVRTQVRADRLTIGPSIRTIQRFIMRTFSQVSLY